LSCMRPENIRSGFCLPKMRMPSGHSGNATPAAKSQALVEEDEETLVGQNKVLVEGMVGSCSFHPSYRHNRLVGDIICIPGLARQLMKEPLGNKVR
jgi:hypothetical protein